MENQNLDKYYINGEWVKPQSEERFPVLNPANEKQIGEIFLGNQRDVDVAVEAATNAVGSFSKMSKEERLGLLNNLLKETRKRMEDLAKAMSAEMGAPMTMAREEQASVAEGHLEAFIKALEEQEARFVLDNGDTVVREPIGVCGLITPWNWPINQIVLKVIPALAAGCPCVLKPSEYTPISATIYAEIVHAAGYPAGAFNMIQGAGEVVGDALSKHPDVQMVSFTGSIRAGKEVTKNSAETFKRVTLEMGGKSPYLIFEDADLEESVNDVLNTCFLNTGQTCDAPTRLLVQRSCYEKACEIAKDITSSQEYGDPSQEGNFLGPLFDKIQYDRVQNMIQVGIDEGATLLAGGPGKPKGFETGHYVKATVFSDVTNQMRVAREEIFGPVIVMIPFEDEKEAIEIANDTEYGLAAFLRTADEERAERVAAALQAGSVYINGGAFNFGSPFGGYKKSGNGREGGIFGLEDYQELKTLHFG